MYWHNTMIHIGAKARVVFLNNSADYGGAVYIGDYGMITVGTESHVIFTYNYATEGGAIALFSATLITDREANLTFSHNSAAFGRALELVNSIAHMNTSGITFYDNRALYGGAIDSFYGAGHDYQHQIE